MKLRCTSNESRLLHRVCARLHERVTRCTLLLAVGVVYATLAFGAAPSMAASPAPVADLTTAQLTAEQRKLAAQVEELGTQLLMMDERRGALEQQQLEAERALSQWVVEVYRAGGRDHAIRVGMLQSRSITQFIDRLRIEESIASHRARLVASLTEIEAALDVDELDRGPSIVALDQTQQRLARIATELDVRARIQAGRRAARAAAQRRAKNRAAAAATQAGKSTGANAASPMGTTVAYTSGMGAAVSAVQIDAYLASKGSPMVGNGAAFVASGARWRLDPRVLVAIAGAESNFGQITCGPNNAWGWACPNDPAEFATWAAAIDTVAQGLRRYYLDEGRTSVVLIQQKYAPSGAANDPTGLNNHWVKNVSKFLIELGGNPLIVGPGPAPNSTIPDIGGLGLLGD